MDPGAGGRALQPPDPCSGPSRVPRAARSRSTRCCRASTHPSASRATTPTRSARTSRKPGASATCTLPRRVGGGAGTMGAVLGRRRGDRSRQSLERRAARRTRATAAPTGCSALRRIQPRHQAHPERRGELAKADPAYGKLVESQPGRARTVGVAEALALVDALDDAVAKSPRSLHVDGCAGKARARSRQGRGAAIIGLLGHAALPEEGHEERSSSWRRRGCSPRSRRRRTVILPSRDGAVRVR